MIFNDDDIIIIYFLFLAPIRALGETMSDLCVSGTLFIQFERKFEGELDRELKRELE